jgi:hypothetical protein
MASVSQGLVIMARLTITAGLDIGEQMGFATPLHQRAGAGAPIASVHRAQVHY